MNENIVEEKSYQFALRIVNLYKYLVNNKEFILSKQILRSGTSIGANICEATAGQSKKDFIAKLSIAHKEAVETHYWLRLLKDTAYIKQEQFNSIIVDNEEIQKLLTTILKTSKLSIK